MGYVYIKGVRLSILKKSPGGTIIPGGAFIRESRVVIFVTLNFNLKRTLTNRGVNSLCQQK